MTNFHIPSPTWSFCFKPSLIKLNKMFVSCLFSGVCCNDSEEPRHFCAHKDQWSWYDQQQRQIEVRGVKFNVAEEVMGRNNWKFKKKKKKEQKEKKRKIYGPPYLLAEFFIDPLQEPVCLHRPPHFRVFHVNIWATLGAMALFFIDDPIGVSRPQTPAGAGLVIKLLFGSVS